MAKRQIKVKILENGTIQFDNSKNPDEARILKELSDLATMLTGDPKGFVVEAHTHAHSHEHLHVDEHVHAGV